MRASWQMPQGSWTIRYDCALRDVPPLLLMEMLGQLRSVADDLATIGEQSGVWNIVRSEELHLQVKGWRFAYRVPARGVLTVVGAHLIPAHETAQHV